MSGKRAKRERQKYGSKAERRYGKAWMEWRQSEPAEWRVISRIVWKLRKPKPKDFGLR